MSRAHFGCAGREWKMNKLYRNRKQGMLFGVCAGIAEYFGIDVTVVRVLTVIGTLIFTPMFLVAYFMLGFLLPVKPVLADEEERPRDPLQRQVRASPHDTLTRIRHRFTDLDMRLQRLEKYVTSQRYRLDREFEQLRDDGGAAPR